MIKRLYVGDDMCEIFPENINVSLYSKRKCKNWHDLIQSASKKQKKTIQITQELCFFSVSNTWSQGSVLFTNITAVFFISTKRRKLRWNKIKGGARKVSDRGDRCSEVWQSLNNSELGSTPVTQQSVITCVWKSRKMTFIQNVQREKLSHWETHFTMPLYQRNFVTQFERVWWGPHVERFPDMSI